MILDQIRGLSYSENKKKLLEDVSEEKLLFWELRFWQDSFITPKILTEFNNIALPSLQSTFICKELDFDIENGTI